MSTNTIRTLRLFAAVLALGAYPASAEDRPLAIVGATVFDASGAPPRAATVIIQGQRILAVGSDVAVPADATVIDATGKALLPGFFDVHTHWQGATPEIATAYIRSGVTTVYDFAQQPESFAPRREWLANLVGPHVNFAARISTPGGHGADWGDQATTVWINSPEQARAAVERLEPYQPDLIKAFTDGWRYGRSADNASMDEGTLAALTEAAHANDLKVVTHTVTIGRGAAAARARVDALVHSLQDAVMDNGTLGQIVQSGIAMAPTLAVYDPEKGGHLDPDDPVDQQRLTTFEWALENVKIMFDAGVPIALGTDAGMPGTPHGPSTLHEMELLVRAGLTPTEALIAGTAASAQVMGLEADRGSIESGKRADIVLIDGMPWRDIADVHKIYGVLIDGRLVVGPGAPPLPAVNSAPHLPAVTVQSLIDNFERSDGRTNLDTLRLQDIDRGISRSVVVTQIVPREGGNGRALLVVAQMSAAEDPFAGISFPLTRGSVRPADLRQYTAVRFSLRGEGRYIVTLSGVGGSWSAEVAGSPEWQELSVPFATLTGSANERFQSGPWSGEAIYEVEISTSRPGGETFVFELDDLRFQ